MLNEIRVAAARQLARQSLKRIKSDCERLLSDQGELDGMAHARDLVERLDAPDDSTLDGFFDYLATELSPDPDVVLRCAIAYRDAPGTATLAALTEAAEPARQELFRRLNRAPGGTAAVLKLRRALLKRLRAQPELASIEADLHHLLGSWFNPGFLKMQRVNWDSPARLLEKIIVHEAVHSIDGWDDLRRRLRPDRRCFAFFHHQLPGEPLIFVEVALLPEVPGAIAPLIDKASTPLPEGQFRVAAFYGISNCERGLRGVSMGNFLIKRVAEQLQSELPKLRTFITLSPIPGFANWLLGSPDFDALGAATQRKRGAVAKLQAARDLLAERCGGSLAALRQRGKAAALDDEGQAAMLTLAAAYLVQASPTPQGDPVARFHLDNGARLERLNPHADLSRQGPAAVLRHDGQLPLRSRPDRGQPRPVPPGRSGLLARRVAPALRPVQRTPPP